MLTNYSKHSGLNNKHLIPHSFCRSGIWEWLMWVVLAQGLSWGCRQAVSQDHSHLKDRLGLEDLLPRWLPHTAVAVPHLQLLSTVLLEYPQETAAGFPRVSDTRQSKEAAMPFIAISDTPPLAYSICWKGITKFSLYSEGGEGSQPFREKHIKEFVGRF